MKRMACVVAGIASALTACGSREPGASDATASGEAPPITAAAPVAPSADGPMYQGGQTRFRTASGARCTGRVAASMSSSAFCYLAANDDVRCAGVIAGVDHGMAFRAIGQTGASQIMLMFGNNGMCVTTTAHTVLCTGTNTNAVGQAATPAAFTRWTAHADIAAIGTGTWEQICGITLAGQVFCGGSPNFGDPHDIGPAGQTALWVDTSGAARLSDATVLRPAESRTECQVRTTGLACPSMTWGPSDGTVVMGTRIAMTAADPQACWLTDDATVTCHDGRRFAPNRVLYLAASTYSDSLCAIYNDGSVWCIGSNTAGKLGTGDAAPLTTETMVAPPGSARVGCE